MRWHNGALALDDHPHLDAERALVGFGGEVPACLALADLWSDGVADGGFLPEWVDEAALGSVRRSWLDSALERMRTQGFHEFLRHLPMARAERMGRFLQGHPTPWIDQAAAAVSAAVVDGPGVTCGHAPMLIGQAVAHRLRRAVAAVVSAGTGLPLGAAALLPVLVDQRPGPAIVAGTVSGPGRGVAIGIAPGWLHRVWAVGAPVLDDRLVLDLAVPADGPAGSAPDRATATVVGWSPAGGPVIEELAVVLVDGSWVAAR